MSACTACGVDLDPYRDEVTRLTAALAAAQDEIEKLLSEKEELREQVSVLQNQPPLVRVIDINDDPDCIVTEGSHWHTLGGAS